ncbi:hypothetical protein BC833DRAFT_626590 [Globomyces pollinis-pini]|nr:hypothetical protein BC833DRAFT_626590 [Globomyces pollinis-pini]
MNVIQATIAALASQKTPQDIAKMPGKKVHDLEMTYYGMDLPNMEFTLVFKILLIVVFNVLDIL